MPWSEKTGNWMCYQVDVWCVPVEWSWEMWTSPYRKDDWYLYHRYYCEWFHEIEARVKSDAGKNLYTRRIVEIELWEQRRSDGVWVPFAWS